MKNIFAAAITLITMIGGLASCSDDMLGDVTNGNGTVTFTASLESGLDTRAMGDGTSANRLQYAIYDSEGNHVDHGSVSLTNKAASVTLNLTLGSTYDIVFFADRRSSSPYTFDFNNHIVTIDYSKMNGSGKTLKYDFDCFYQVKKGYKAGSSNRESVILTRPVAQINFGTDDLESEIVGKTFGSASSIYLGITTTACNTLDLLSGDVSGSAEVSLPFKRPVDYSLGDFPVSGYTYLTSGYFLVEDPAAVRNITLNVKKFTSDASPIVTLSIPDAPVKKNYRTNIYGSLLTTTANWNVTIEPMFGGRTDIWLGDSEEPEKKDENTYSVNTPAQLAGLAKMVNSGNDFAGKTVLLNVDIDLANRNWTPIGTDDNPFNGIFNGQNHVISNLNITLGSTSIPAGLFGHLNSNGSNKGELRNFTVDGATVNTLAATPAEHATGVVLGKIYTGNCVENVTVKNATVDAYRWVGGVVGKGYGSVNYCTVENVKITSHLENLTSSWNNGDMAGAIIGQQDEGSFTLIGNKASNVEISGYRHLGGLLGYVHHGNAESHKIVKDNSISGGVVSQNFAHNYDNITAGSLMGEISGYYSKKDGATYIDESNNTATGVKLVLPSAVTDAASLVAAAGTGGFVKLDADIDMTSVQGEITLKEPTNINLNGHTLTVNSNALSVATDLTIDGEGTLTSNGFTLIGKPGSTIIISGGTISTSGTKASSQAINTQGDLVMTDGKIKNDKGTALTFSWGGEYPATEHKVTISGGEIIGGNEYALNLYGGSTDVSRKVTISGGKFIGASGARADGYVDVTITGGYFIQTSASASGHAFCAGAEGWLTGTNVTISGGYFYGDAGFSICNAGNAKTTVSGAYINKNGGGFTPADGKSVVTLASPASITVNDCSYSFGYQVK